jgi:uracil-DNA glycosylase
MKKDWEKLLKEELNATYFQDLMTFINTERESGKRIYPEEKDLFSAFSLTSFELTKVVILGQDPYHGEGQAHGLAFSVKKGVSKPPSLVNIFKELQGDLGISSPNHGDLTSWAKQGVLLLNAVLSVEAAKPGSHQQRGWEQFTDKVIEVLNLKKNHLVFILWGSPAQKKIKMLNSKKHLILTSPHPSPLSSYRGFFGSKPFSKCNEYLKQNGIKEIDWTIKDDSSEDSFHF